MGRIDTRPLTENELDNIFGGRKLPIGTTMKKGDYHFYLQREKDVLHVSGGNLINSLHVGHLNEESQNYVPISSEEFEGVIKKAIYELEIGKYWNS